MVVFKKDINGCGGHGLFASGFFEVKALYAPTCVHHIWISYKLQAWKATS